MKTEKSTNRVGSAEAQTDKKLHISDVMFSEERTEVKCCIGGYVIEKDQFGATGRIFKCVKCNT